MKDVKYWGMFCVGKLFSQIYKAEPHVKTDLEECSPKSENAIAFITRTENNNGCDCFVKNKGVSGVENGNAIIIGDTTSTFFYQRQSFIAGDHIVVCRADWINYRTALFLKTVLEKDRYRYNYGRPFKIDLIKTMQIKLPMTQSGDPDWQYMSAFISEIERRENKIVIGDSLVTKNAVRNNYVSTEGWGDFTIEQLFERFEEGKANAGMLEEGNDCLYLGAKKDDNCVMRHCARNPDLIQAGNCIVFICNGEGSVGYTNYMDREFIATTDLVMGYSERLNKYNGLFITTILDRERPKYSFGRKWKNHLRDTVIKLPQTADGKPDWDLMERWIRSLPYGDRI